MLLFSGTKLALSDISSINSEPSGLFIIIQKFNETLNTFLSILSSRHMVMRKYHVSH